MIFAIFYLVNYIDKNLCLNKKLLLINVDPIPFPPKILMLVGDHDGKCNVFSPAADYKLVVAHSNYQVAQDWFLEDEYERVKGQLLAEEIM